MLLNVAVTGAAASVAKNTTSHYVIRVLLTRNWGKNSNSDSTVAVSRSKTQVLLQTARMYVYTATNDLVPVQVLMDIGSHHSYVSNQLMAKLKLKPLRQQHLTLNTFGNDKRKCDLTMGEEIEITALSFPAIYSPLQVPVELDRYPHLQELDLADASPSEQLSDIIDMLIGSDYYWDIVIGDLKRSGNGPIAVSSKFGWLLSGPVKSKKWEVSPTVSNLAVEGLRTVELVTEMGMTPG